MPAVPVVPRSLSNYVPEDQSSRTVVRHLAGYEPFQEWVDSRGFDAGQIAETVTRFGAFVRAHRTELSGAVAEEALAIFLGNILAQMRTDVAWVGFEDQLPSVGVPPHFYEPLPLLRFMLESDEEDFRVSVLKIEEWATALQ